MIKRYLQFISESVDVEDESMTNQINATIDNFLNSTETGKNISEMPDDKRLEMINDIKLALVEIYKKGSWYRYRHFFPFGHDEEPIVLSHSYEYMDDYIDRYCKDYGKYPEIVAPVHKSNLKNFETFDFSQTLPVASKSTLTNFYHCDDCNALWREFNSNTDTCKFCRSTAIEELSEDEWYETVGDRLDDDEIEEMESDRKSDDDNFVDLYNLRKNEAKTYGVEILPKEALEELSADYVDYKNPENKIEVFPDPRVDGAYAVRVYVKKHDHTFDLLWSRDGFEGVEFTSWPPTSGNLKFFI